MPGEGSRCALADNIITAGTDTKVLVSDRSLPDGDPATLPAPPDDDMNAPTGQPVPVRFLYYTSGTTADPKGARHGDRSLMSASVGMSERLGLADDDRFALVFPFTHIAGGVYIYAAVAYGLTFVLDEAFDPATTLTLLRREDITQGGAGTFFHQMYLKAQQDLPAGEKLFPSIRTFPGGGAPKPPSLHHELKASFGVGVVLSSSATCVQVPATFSKTQTAPLPPPVFGSPTTATFPSIATERPNDPNIDRSLRTCAEVMPSRSASRCDEIRRLPSASTSSSTR